MRVRGREGEGKHKEVKTEVREKGKKGRGSSHFLISGMTIVGRDIMALTEAIYMGIQKTA